MTEAAIFNGAQWYGTSSALLESASGVVGRISQAPLF